MQITFNQSEVEGILAAHVATYFPHIESEAVCNIHVNEDGTALVIIGEDIQEDTPPVVDKKPRQRRARNPQEAKHRPVDPTPEPEVKEEIQTSIGGQNGNSTPEPEAEQGEQVVEPTEALKEEATEQAEAAASQEVSEEAAVQEEVQEEAVEKPATTKPSLFANLAKR